MTTETESSPSSPSSEKSDQSTPKAADTLQKSPQSEVAPADELQQLPHVYPPAILYAKGDSLAACQSAKKILEDGASDDEAKKNAQLFLKTVSMDRMMKGVIILASVIVLFIVLMLYVF